MSTLGIFSQDRNAGTLLAAPTTGAFEVQANSDSVRFVAELDIGLVCALLAGVVMSLCRDIYCQGVALMTSVAICGLATAPPGLSMTFILSYLLFALTGAGDTVSMVIRNTIRQLNTPDSLRGRMCGVNMIFFMDGPQSIPDPQPPIPSP